MYHQTYDCCEITESNIVGTLRSTTPGLRVYELKIPSSIEMTITAVQLLPRTDGDTLKKRYTM